MRPRRRPSLRSLLLAGVYFSLVAAGWFAGRALLDFWASDVLPGAARRPWTLLLTATVIYVLASAIPFVPGAEIGLGLLLMFGDRVAVLVYAAMVLALSLAYLVGRFVPTAWIARLFARLGQHRARDLVLDMAPLDPGQRAELLSARAPRRVVPFLLRHRYLALAVVLNLPGNSLLGGGGGIALAAGMSRLYSVPAFLTTVALAVAPIPAVVLLVSFWL